MLYVFRYASLNLVFLLFYACENIAGRRIHLGASLRCEASEQTNSLNVLLLLRVGRRCGSTHMSKDRVNRQPSYEVLTGPTERPVAYASEAKITRTRTRIPPPVKIYPTVIVCTLLLVLRSCRRCRHRGRTLYLRTLCDLIARSLSELCASARGWQHGLVVRCTEGN